MRTSEERNAQERHTVLPVSGAETAPRVQQIWEEIMSGLWYFWGSLALLLGGYFVYGAFVEKVFGAVSGVSRRSKAGATA